MGWDRTDFKGMMEYTQASTFHERTPTNELRMPRIQHCEQLLQSQHGRAY